MNDGLQLLLDRMKTHPEEFTLQSSRWGSLVRDFESVFTTEEWTTYNEALKDARRELFSSTVMERLLTEEREDREALSGFNDVRKRHAIQKAQARSPQAFGAAPVKAEGQPMVIDASMLGVPKKIRFSQTELQQLQVLKEWANEQGEGK